MITSRRPALSLCFFALLSTECAGSQRAVEQETTPADTDGGVSVDAAPPPSEEDNQEETAHESARSDELFEVRSRSEVDRNFSLLIERHYENEQQARRIAAAEKLCSLSREARPSLLLDASDDNGDSRCRWWSSQISGLKIPTTITQDALAYYSGLIDTLRQGSDALSGLGELDSARLEYRATASHQDYFAHQGHHFSNVDVVRMELSWTHFCGATCAFGFSAIRIVVFPEEGSPLSLGDGETAVWGG